MRSLTKVPYVVISNPNGSQFVRMLRAFVNEEAWSCPGLEETEWLNQAAQEPVKKFLVEWKRASGDREARSELIKTTDPRVLRAAIEEPGGLELVLGWYDDDDVWHPGAAGLTEQEARAWQMVIERFEAKEIAQYLDGKRRRTKQFGVSLRTVEDLIQNGRQKLQALFANRP